MPDLRDFLVRIALDDAFRDLVERDADAAFEGYALDEAQRATLRRPDEAWLALLGAVVREAAPQVHTPPAAREAGPTMPEARLLLTLRPHTHDDGRLGWAATLRPWPSPVEDGALGLLIRVVPRTVAIDGGFKLTYEATIQPPPAGDDDADAPVAEGPAATSDERIDRAAAAVREAPADQRYARLRDLLAVLGP